MPRYILEGTWSGYRSSQERVCHREVIKTPEYPVKSIRFTDNTMLWLSVRPAKRGEKVVPIRGYDTLLSECRIFGLTGFVTVDQVSRCEKHWSLVRSISRDIAWLDPYMDREKVGWGGHLAVCDTTKVKRRWQMYVWDKVGCDYTCGIAVAVARSADEARALLIKTATQKATLELDGAAFHVNFVTNKLKEDIAVAPAHIYDFPSAAFCFGGS
jgi:hypothetical protein